MPSSPISPCPSCPPHAAGGHGCAVYSSSVTDAEWAILEPLLPAPGSTAGRGGRPEKHCRRVIVDAILYIVRGGIAWRQLPVEFPPAGTVYAVFARWARSGGWQRILDALRDRLRVRAGRDRCPTAAIIDSQTVPAADTVPRSSRGWDGAKRTNGVKRHIAVDVNGLLLGVVVTAASIQDRDAAHRLLAALRGSFSTIALVWADGGYPGRLLIWAKDVLTLTMQIIKRIPRRHWFPRPAPHLGGREKFRVDQQAPPLRARLRNQTRPPRSHGPPRHDHDHDQATRPNLTVFKHPLSVLMLDLDNFKRINDTHGHATGDRILVAIADTLRRIGGAETVIARVGGEEFLVAEHNGTREALQTAEAMRLAIAATPWGVTASLGVSSIRLSSEHQNLDRQIIERLVEVADAAMYEAKRAGGNQVRHVDMAAPRRP